MFVRCYNTCLTTMSILSNVKSPSSSSLSTMTTGLPRLYLGTMTFGWSQTSSYVDETVAAQMVQTFIAHNNNKNNEKQSITTLEQPHYVDTARIYAGGKTERIVGKILGELQSNNQIRLSTKAHPSQKGGLSKLGIQAQLEQSKEACGVDTFAEFYLHQPDTEHPLLESLEFMHELVSNGLVQTVGMSNYHWTEVKRAFELCEQHGLTPPRVYQGIYNPLNRAVEHDLLPLLKQHGCSFVAYNPLAAGLLSGKHTDLNTVKKGRFTNNPNYLPRFYDQANFQAVQLIRDQCENEGISMVEATYRWLFVHSALDETDGVLLGASSLQQLGQNLNACSVAARHDGTLSDDMVRVFDEAWEITKNSPFPYWRSFSSDMPDRENLNQGASYQAVKK